MTEERLSELPALAHFAKVTNCRGHVVAEMYV